MCCSPWGGKESDTTERLNGAEFPLWEKKSKATFQVEPRYVLTLVAVFPHTNFHTCKSP